MFNATTTVATSSAENYLRKLCIHWQQRFAVEFDAKSGRIDFGDGQSTRIFATPESLEIIIFAPQESVGKELEDIIAEHIKRFARKETLIFNWRIAD